MFAMYTVADLADRYDVLILTLVEAVELLNGDKRSSAQLATTASKLMSEKVKENLHSPQSKKLADQMFHAATESVKSKLPKSEDDAEDEKKKAKTSSNLDEKAQFLQNSIEENKEAMKLSIAVACQLVRAFVGFSAEIKQEVSNPYERSLLFECKCLLLN
jgi:hypothetical protein